MSLVAVAVPAGADALGCASVITTSVVLQQDLNCTGNGLVLGASNITVDLNGHTLDGGSVGLAGVNVSPHQALSGVTIKNGTIQGFQVGIANAPNLGGTITEANYFGLRIANNRNGFSFGRDSDGSRVDRSMISDNGVGVLLGESTSGVTVTRSTLTSNSVGVRGSEANANTIIGNSVHDNGVGLSFFRSDGIVISNNAIDNNTLGIAPGPSDFDNGQIITGNAITRNAIGIDFGDRLGRGGHTVQNNRFDSNSSAGITIVLGTSPGGSVPTIISGNKFNGNGGSPDPGQPEINDGIYARVPPGPLVTIANNVAIRSGDYGIDASGVTDGGGNIGAANGNPAQCVGVVCRGPG